MSSIEQGLRYVASIDSKMDINNLHNKTYAVLRSTPRANFWQFPSVGVLGNISQINWNATVPDVETYLNRRCYVQLGFNITFTGVSAGAGITLLQCAGYQAAAGVSAGNTSATTDSLRCLPLSQLFQTFTVTINNNAITQPIGLYSRIFQRFQRCRDDQNLDLSMSPAAPDQSFQYSDLFGSNLNPQGIYGDNNYDQRGAFSGVTVLRNDSTGVADTAIVSVYLVEPFWISPFAFDRNDEPVSLIGIRNFNVSAICGGRGSGALAGQAGSVWSHSNGIPGLSGTITNATVNFTSANLFLNFITPPEGYSLPRQVYYSWVNPTFYQQSTVTVAPGAQTSQNSQTIQLDTVPSRMYAWMDKPDASMDMTQTDTVPFNMNSISIRWDTVANILADMTPQDIYQMSVGSGFTSTWNQAYGTIAFPAYSGAVATPTGTGMIACINFGTNLPLPAGQCPGLAGRHTLQVRLTCTNISTQSVANAVVNILIVEEGVMYINNQTVQFSSGVVSQEDVKMTQGMIPISHMPSKNILGGAFWDDVLNFVKRAGPSVFRALKSYLPAPAQAAGEAVLSAYGKGVSGGAMIQQRQLGMLRG